MIAKISVDSSGGTGLTSWLTTRVLFGLLGVVENRKIALSAEGSARVLTVSESEQSQ
jgi:hypothetical protein